jgi:hypothetical protein
MTEMSQLPSRFQEEPPVTPLPLRYRPMGRILQILLIIVISAALLGAFSWLMARRNTQASPRGKIVVAARDLKPYQHLQAGDISLDRVDSHVAGTVLTDFSPLVDGAITLRAIDKGAAVTAESVTVFPAGVDLASTVILSIPMSANEAVRSALEPGMSVLVIANAVSDTVASSVTSVTVPLVDLTEKDAIVAASPEVAVQLSLCLPPQGRLVLAPAIDR